jgi:hypothetical protein
VVSADLACDPIPGMHDVAILRSVLQTLSAEEARKVLRMSIRRSIPESGCTSLEEACSTTRDSSLNLL